MSLEVKLSLPKTIRIKTMRNRKIRSEYSYFSRRIIEQEHTSVIRFIQISPFLSILNFCLTALYGFRCLGIEFCCKESCLSTKRNIPVIVLKLAGNIQIRTSIVKLALGMSISILVLIAGISVFCALPINASSYQLNNTSEMQSSNAISGIVNANTTIDIISPNATNSTLGVNTASTNQTNDTDSTGISPGNITGTGRRH